MFRAILPHMRARKSGVIANIASVASHIGVPGGGIYCASKAANSIHSEALAGEIAHLGIEITAVEPGYFRTAIFEETNRKRAEKRIEDIRETVDEMMRVGVLEQNGKQAGDPVRGAEVLVEALTKTGRCVGRKLPIRMALGRDAVERIPQMLEGQRKEVEEWKDITRDCDFENN